MLSLQHNDCGPMLLAWGHNRLCKLGFTDALEDIELHRRKAKQSVADNRWGVMINEVQYPQLNALLLASAHPMMVINVHQSHKPRDVTSTQIDRGLIPVSIYRRVS